MNTDGQAEVAARCVCVAAILSTTQAGGAIFSGRDEEGEQVRVVADHKVLPRIPALGETWTVTGTFAIHATHGRQLRATRCSYHLPEGKMLAQYLARHPDFKNIGDVKAARLYETFDSDLLRILDEGDVEALSAVLTPTTAARVVTVWADKRAEGTLIGFLDRHGFDIRLANKIRRAWSDQAMEVLETNPYFMLAFAGWKSVDAAASRLGVSKGDQRRLVGGVEGSLYDRMMDSHTLTSHATLCEMVRKKLSVQAPQLAIEMALDEGAIIGDSGAGYQPVGAAALETGIAERLRRMIAGELPVQFGLLDRLEENCGEIDDHWLSQCIAEVESKLPFALNKEQRAAVVMVAKHRFSVLMGGAGTGKTTVLKACIQVATRLHLGVFQMALAGRAAKRIREATGHAATTIAKFLAEVKSGRLEISPSSLIVVDEASMLDLPTMYRLLSCVPEGARLLLVGDSAQLPPIGFGLVFHLLANSAAVPRTNLIEVHRQALSTGIPAIADSIRQHRVPTLKHFDGRAPGVSFVECANAEIVGRLFEVTHAWAGDEWQILGATKEGSAGIIGINWVFHERFLGAKVLKGWRFAVGDPVIHVVNDYERDLMNGSLGRIVDVSQEAGLLVVFDEKEHWFAVEELAGRLELAYAISVHKAQGSQFNRVAVAVTKSQILDHALIYTALTRGETQVTFVGDKVAFNAAILNPPSATRREVNLRV